MKNYFISGGLIVILAAIIGIWLQRVMPLYGFPMGTGIGLAFVIGYFTKK